MEQNYTFDSAQVKRARIKLAWAQVEIVTGADEAHQLLIAGDDESIAELRVEHSGDELTVVQPQLSYAKEVLQRSRWLQVSLHVARGFAGDLDVDTVTGLIGASKITGDDISLTTVSGPIRARGVTANSLLLHSVAGALSGEGLEAKRGNLRTVSGMISLENIAFGATKVFTISGQVSLSLLGSCRTLDLQSVSGNVAITVDGPAKAALHSLSGKFLLSEDVESAPGCLEIGASSVSGDLSVKRRQA